MFTSSYIQSYEIQKDGRIYVTEIHIDEDGKQTSIIYISEANADIQSVLDNRRTLMNEAEEINTYQITNEDGTTTNL